MKRIIFIIIAGLFLMATLPVVSLISTSENKDILPSDESIVKEVIAESSVEEKQDNIFKILDTSSGKIITIDDKEFCYGAVAYEMPPGFENEALKAQTVALYTFFSRKRQIQRQNPDGTLKGADFSADLSEGQFYISDEQRKKNWGTLYDKSMEKIKKAVDSVFGEVIVDSKGELIDACYHSASAGSTESAEDIFKTERDYLQPVPSPWDVDSPDFITKVTVSEDEFIKKMKENSPDIKFSDDPEKFISSIKKTASGSVTETVIGNEKFTGSDIRVIFGLKSAAFDIVYADRKFTFTVRGYGHGVGLSQWGANGMAAQGSSYREILSHYYTNTKIIKQ